MMRMETVVAVGLLGAGLLVWLATPPAPQADPALPERASARVILAQPLR